MPGVRLFSGLSCRFGSTVYLIKTVFFSQFFGNKKVPLCHRCIPSQKGRQNTARELHCVSKKRPTLELLYCCNRTSGVAGPLAAWCGGQICRPNFLGFGQVAQLSQRDRATRQLLRFANLRCGIFEPPFWGLGET